MTTSRIVAGILFAAALGSTVPAGPSAAAGMSAQEALRRHVAARGGAERWRATTALEITGSHTSFSVPSPFRLIRKRPNQYRFEQVVLGRPVVEVYDGRKAWWINGLMGNTWPLPAPDSASAAIAREAAFDTPLIGHERDGHSIEMEGPETFEGKRAFKLKVTRKDGAPETWYLDAGSFLEIARISRTVDFGQEMEKRSYFSDFRPEAGLVIPHRIEMEYGTRNEILEVTKVRTEIDGADLFDMPPPEGMGALAPLAGDWSLRIETRQHPRAPWEAKETTSSIVKLLDGGLLEERFSHVDQGLESQILRAWSYDRFARLYRISQTDNYSFHQNILEGTLGQDGRLIATNEKSGTTLKTPDETIHHRIVAYEIGPDDFKVDWESSRDAGVTWNTDVKYTYKRR